MPELTPEVREKLITLAQQAFENAYVPYSKFHVGSAILTEDGDIFTGCNVENIAYPVGCCAERTATVKMVSEKGPQAKIKYIAVATKADIPCTPCGMCRQTIQEFGPNAVVIYKGDKGYEERTISQLLPGAFTDFVSLEDDGTHTSIQSGA